MLSVCNIFITGMAAVVQACTDSAFASFSKRFQIMPAEKGTEYMRRFCESAMHVETARLNFTMALNDRAHLPTQSCWRTEAVATCSGLKVNDSVDTTAESVDWRKAGALSPIKNQGRCGSCWAFATIEAVESALFLAETWPTPVRRLAVQPLLDCDSEDDACGGGNPALALTFLDAFGDCTEADYPYQGSKGRCRLSEKESALPAHDLSCTYVSDEPGSLERYVAKAPVIVGIAANSQDFQLYSSGVFDGDCGETMDHAITVVGFTDTYWLIRNSWGEGWGEQGFMRMGREAAKRCKLLDAALAVHAEPLRHFPVLA